MSEDRRLTALEERLAHQDRVIEEMSTVLADLWREIDRLKRQVRAMDEQMAAVEHLARSSRSEPPPPHY